MMPAGDDEAMDGQCAGTPYVMLPGGDECYDQEDGSVQRAVFMTRRAFG
jgi:hypothetical protein